MRHAAVLVVLVLAVTGGLGRSFGTPSSQSPAAAGP